MQLDNYLIHALQDSATPPDAPLVAAAGLAANETTHIKISANISPLNLDSPISYADHPQPLADAIAAPQPLVVVDALTAPVAVDHLVAADDALATPITTPSCRGRCRRGAVYHDLLPHAMTIY